METVFRTNIKAIVYSLFSGIVAMIASVYVGVYYLDRTDLSAGGLAILLPMLLLALFGVWLALRPFIRPTTLRLALAGITYSKGKKELALNWGDIKDVLATSQAEGFDGTVVIVPNSGKNVYISPYFELGLGYQELAKKILFHKYLAEKMSPEEAQDKADESVRASRKVEVKTTLIIIVALLVLVAVAIWSFFH